MLPLIWLIIGVVLAVAEVFTLDFVLIMFGGGAFAAALAGAVEAPLPVQLLVFAAVSVLGLVAVRPSIKRRLHRRSEERPMGVEAIEGTLGTVVSNTGSGVEVQSVAVLNMPSSSSELPVDHRPRSLLGREPNTVRHVITLPVEHQELGPTRRVTETSVCRPTTCRDEARRDSHPWVMLRLLSVASSTASAHSRCSGRCWVRLTLSVHIVGYS